MDRTYDIPSNSITGNWKYGRGGPAGGTQHLLLPHHGLQLAGYLLLAVSSLTAISDPWYRRPAQESQTFHAGIRRPKRFSPAEICAFTFGIMDRAEEARRQAAQREADVSAVWEETA